MSTSQPLFEKLETRRHELGLSQSALAERCGVSLPTVHRILSGHNSSASFESTMAIAHAMGMELDAIPILPADEVLERQARKKAERLVGMVQGTSALEAQAVSSRQISQMIAKTIHELLTGSRRRLWAE
jgi:transcriptional regulator with XRE-family HTH domain